MNKLLVGFMIVWVVAMVVVYSLADEGTQLLLLGTAIGVITTLPCAAAITYILMRRRVAPEPEPTPQAMPDDIHFAHPLNKIIVKMDGETYVMVKLAEPVGRLWERQTIYIGDGRGGRQ